VARSEFSTPRWAPAVWSAASSPGGDPQGANPDRGVRGRRGRGGLSARLAAAPNLVVAARLLALSATAGAPLGPADTLLGSYTAYYLPMIHRQAVVIEGPVSAKCAFRQRPIVASTHTSPRPESTFSMSSTCHRLDLLALTFDDEPAVANVGLIARPPPAASQRGELEVDNPTGAREAGPISAG
jgi:hypothetical protein